MSFARPHSPYDPPPYYFDLYDRQQLEQAAVGDWAQRNDIPTEAANVNAWRGRRSPAEIHRARAGYLGSVTHIDHSMKLRWVDPMSSSLSFPGNPPN